jgi:hypothetical protein
MLVGNFKIEDDTCIKVYDPETKTLIAVYESYKDVSKDLRIELKAVQSGCISKNKRFSPRLNKKVALRLANKKTLAEGIKIKSNKKGT